MKRVLVVGGAGFVGRNINLATEAYEVYCLDILPLPQGVSRYKAAYQANLLDADSSELISKINPEVLVVLAGVQFQSPIQKTYQREKSFSMNIDIANQIKLISGQNANIKHVVYVSTDMVYGRQNLEILKEEVVPKPIGEYGASKLQAEKILNQISTTLTVIRPRLIVGPGREGTLALLAKFIKLGLPVPLIGNGTNRYQMISVFDLWNAIELVLDLGKAGTFNIGSDNPPTLNELIPDVIKALGRRNRIVKLPKKISEQCLLFLDRLNLSPLAPEQFLIAGQNCVLDTSRIKSLGWTPHDSDFKILSQAMSKLL